MEKEARKEAGWYKMIERIKKKVIEVEQMFGGEKGREGN